MHMSGMGLHAVGCAYTHACVAVYICSGAWALGQRGWWDWLLMTVLKPIAIQLATPGARIVASGYHTLG